MKSVFRKIASSNSRNSRRAENQLNAAYSSQYQREADQPEDGNNEGEDNGSPNVEQPTNVNSGTDDENSLRISAPPVLPVRPVSMKVKLRELKKRSKGRKEPANEKHRMLTNAFRRYMFYLRYRRFIKLKRFSKQQRRLYQVIETIDTERSYKNHLDFCVSKLQRPILQNGLIPEKDLKKIFSNMENILTIATTLLTDMEIKKENDPNLRISECFLGTSHFFKLYKVYINNYDSADAHARKFIKKSSALRKLLDDTVDQHPNHYKLADFLILPVQRIPRYKLLLEGIIKLTPEGHRELESLKKAAASVEDVAEFVNLARVEKMYGEVYEMLRKVLKKEDLVILDKPSRKFQEQGTCLLLAPGWNIEEFMEHAIVLFNDCVVFISSKKKKLYIVIEFKFANLKKVTYEDEEIIILEVIKMGARQEIHMFLDKDQMFFYDKMVECIKESKVKMRTNTSILSQFSFTGYTPVKGGVKEEIFE